MRRLLASFTLAVCASAPPLTAQESNLYWGDTHLHTSYSIDAYNWGNVSAGPETAYRFAKGLPVTHPTLLNRVRLKGWLTEDGDTNERVYDVEWAGDRGLEANGRVPAIGSTVDVETLTYDNTIGSAELSTVWVDPDFDPAERAFYYVRVLEIPTLRHSTYDAVAMGQDPAEATPRPSVIQERALSSPIWYTP